MPPETILDQIVRAKTRELERLKRQLPLEALEERVKALPVPRNLSGALMGDQVRLIAEVKRASPSRGLLAPHFNPVGLARTYAENGAAAISVLTEVDHFQGSLEHLTAVKEATKAQGAPVLRKDFIFDPYQVYESRAAGADALLLIVAILSPSDLKALLQLSLSLFLQCLVEVHNEEELQTALEAGADIIGINNRDLRTFRTDLEVTRRLAPLVPRGKIVVSESGIHTREDTQGLKRLGVHAVLVGEAIMTAPDVAAKVRELAQP